jgi:hypothetical protein
MPFRAGLDSLLVDAYGFQRWQDRSGMFRVW